MRWSVLLALFACVSVPRVSAERMAAMHEVKDEEAVRSCTLLGRFVGSSTQVSDAGLDQARGEARAKCAATGATDSSTIRVGDSRRDHRRRKAYDCPQPR